MKIDVTVRSPKLAVLAAQLSSSGRKEMNEAMGITVREVTRDYLTKISGERHKSAERLGASPTGHLAQAVRAVEASTLNADALSATLTISHVGLSRAFHDVTITPKNAKALTIPVSAIAYGRRAREFQNLFVFKHEGGKAFLAQRDPTSGSFRTLYLLVRSVTQKQDRTLLPSDAEWQKAAAQSALSFIKFNSRHSAR